MNIQHANALRPRRQDDTGIHDPKSVPDKDAEQGHAAAFAEQLWGAGRLHASVGQTQAQSNEAHCQQAHDTSSVAVTAALEPTISTPTWRTWLDDQVSTMSAKAQDKTPINQPGASLQQHVSPLAPEGAAGSLAHADAPSLTYDDRVEALAAVGVTDGGVQEATAILNTAAVLGRPSAEAAFQPMEVGSPGDTVTLVEPGSEMGARAPEATSTPVPAGQTYDAAAVRTEGAGGRDATQAPGAFAFYALRDAYSSIVGASGKENAAGGGLAQSSTAKADDATGHARNVLRSDVALLSNTTASASSARTFADRLTDFAAQPGDAAGLNNTVDVFLPPQTTPIDSGTKPDAKDQADYMQAYDVASTIAEVSSKQDEIEDSPEHAQDSLRPVKKTTTQLEDDRPPENEKLPDAWRVGAGIERDPAYSVLNTDLQYSEPVSSAEGDKTSADGLGTSVKLSSQAIAVYRDAMSQNHGTPRSDSKADIARSFSSDDPSQLAADTNLPGARRSTASFAVSLEEADDAGGRHEQIGDTTTVAATHHASKEQQASTSDQATPVISTEAAHVSASETVSTPAKLSERLAAQLTDGARRIQLRVAPAGLGTVDIGVHLQGAQVHLTVRGDHPELTRFLQEGMSDLQKNLQEKGLDLGTTNFQQDSKKNSADTESRDRQSADPHASRTVRSTGLAGSTGAPLREGTSRVINVLV